ncbi:DUF1534 domain-containing protein [Pseudomonas congelans]|nr:DUF1534 domain-containing protein [Pseudomonas congelans]
MPEVPSQTTIVPHALRGNAVLDALRPLLNVQRDAEHWHDGVLAQVSCLKCPSRRLSFRTLQRGNAVPDALRPLLMCRAARFCDAERHEMHANAEHWHDSVQTIIVPNALRPIPSAND